MTTPTQPGAPTAPAPTPGTAPFTVGSQAWLQNQQSIYEDQMRQQTQMKGLDHADLFSAAMTPLEWVGSKAYWLYSNLVARPLSTALIAGQHADVGNGSLFSGQTWNQSWNEAKNVSPGQAMYIDARGFFNDSWEKQQLIGSNKDGTLIWDHPDQINNYFHSGGTAQWASGGMDAVTSWEIDPLTLAGKGLKALRAAAYVKPVVETANPTFRGAAVGAALNLAGKVRGLSPEGMDALQGAWNSRLVTSNIDKSLSNSTFGKFSDYIMDNKQRLGDQFSNWAVNQKWAQTSATAGALAHYLGTADDQQEVNAILAAGMGDGMTAANSMIGKNNVLAAQLQTLWKSRDDWFQNIHGVNPNRLDLADPVHQQYAQQLQAYTDQVNSINQQTRRLSDAAEISNTIKNGLYFNSLVTPTAAKIGQAASKAYHYGDSASLLYNNIMLRPVRMYQQAGNAWSAIRPKGWIKLDDPNSYRELDAQLRDSGAYDDAERATKVSQYINAPYIGKRSMLYGIETDVTKRLAAKYGMDSDAAQVLYDTFQQARGRAFSPQYSEATIDLNGTKVNVAQVDHDGSLTAVHPLLQTQLENEHPIMDFKKMDSILKLNGPSFQGLIDEGKEYREAAQQAATFSGRSTPLQKMTFGLQKSRDAYNSFADLFNHVWKFNAHFRMGYGPRQLADEWLSQAARLGAYNLLSNATQGLRGQFLRGGDMHAPNWMWDPTGYSQRLLDYQTKIDAAKTLQSHLTSNRSMVAAYTLKSEKAIAKRASILGTYDDNLSSLQGNIDGLERSKAQLAMSRAKLTDKRILLPNGQMVNAFGEGPEGRLALDLNSGRASIDSTLGGASSILLNGLRGDLARKTYHWNDAGHLPAWLKNVQYQIAHDPAAMQVVKGMNEDQLTTWLKSREGRGYYRSVGMNNWSEEEHADRIVAHVNHTLPQINPEFDAVRSAVAEGADDKTVAGLMQKTQEGLRPMVNEKDFGIASGKTAGMQMIDKFISGWYRKLGETPVNVLSRNPLAATLYRRHVNEIFANYEQVGKTALTNRDLDQVAQQARKMAIRDVKKYTYNMDFETKAAYAMRFMSPFFGAGAEAINRWARILTEKPDTLGRMAYLYDTPMKIGQEYTYDGRPITDGYATDPTTGKNVLVPMSETMWRFQVPSWLASTMGMTKGENAEIPLSSLALPFRNSPWFNPGEGPIVQAAANQFALSSTQHPEVGDWMQRLGILPTGVTTKSVAQQMMGSTFTSIQESQSDGTIQAMALQAMQEESYRYANGLRSTQPTWTEIMQRAQHMADLKGWFHGSTLLPFSVDFQDPYQFYRDQYKMMQQANPRTADQSFYAKYGASAFAFTGSLNKNNIPGIAPTANAQRAASEFSGLISQYPDLAGMIIGDQGGGPYSQTAWEQQIASGQRTTTTAQDAWNTTQANLGWAMYQSYMSGLTSQLFQRGLTSFNQKGAQDLLQQKIGLVKMLASPTMPDGKTPNAYYNQQWTEAYNSYDPSKQNRQALDMQNLVQAKELQNRQDIQGLAQYLSLRASIQEAMAERAQAKPSKTMSGALSQIYGDINSNQNADLKAAFQQGVMNLIESNTAFQTLHDRYLSTDLGFDHYAGTNMANTYTGQQ